MSNPTITPLPPVPTREDAPAQFVDKADAFLGALPQFQTEANALAAAVEADAVQTAADRVQTGLDRASATASASSALNSPGTNGTSATSLTIGTGTKAFATQAGKAWTVGQGIVIASTASPLNQMTGVMTAYNTSTGAMTVEVTAVGGSGTFAAWTVSLTAGAAMAVASQAEAEAGTDNAKVMTPLRVAQTVAKFGVTPIQAKTSAYTLVPSDVGKLAECSGGFTLTYPPAAALGAGWYTEVANVGGGDVTHAASAGETIDGVGTFVMYPGEVRRIYSDGVALRSIILKRFVKTFTALGTFFKPPGYGLFTIDVWGGGGGGGGGGGSGPGGFRCGGAGGGGGARTLEVITAAEISASVVCTIGAAGLGGSGGNNIDGSSGGAGGSSSFGAMVKAGGGGAGQGGPRSGSSSTGGGGGGIQAPGGNGVGGLTQGGWPSFLSNIAGPNNLGHGGGGGNLGVNGGAAEWGGGGGGGASPNNAAGGGGGSVHAAAGGGAGGSVHSSEQVFGFGSAGVRGTYAQGGGPLAGVGNPTGAGGNGAAAVGVGDGGNGGGGGTLLGGNGSAGAPGKITIWGIV